MKRASVPEQRRLLTDEQAADYIGTSKSYVRAQVAAGHIPRVELPSVDGERRARLLRIDRADLDAFVERMKTGDVCRR